MKRLLLILSFTTFISPAISAPITFTGAELASLPGASFPTGGQIINGDSLVFTDPGVETGVLYRLDLSPFTLATQRIDFTLNVTRLNDDFGRVGQDWRIGLFDGQNFFHVFFSENDFGEFTTFFRANTLSPDETALEGGATFGSFGRISGISATTRLRVVIGAGPTATSVFASVFGTTLRGGSTNITTNQTNDLSLLIVGNEISQNYQIDSLTFNEGVSLPTDIPEPSTFGATLMGLTVLGLYRRRRRV